jgi:hypothetical protein
MLFKIGKALRGSRQAPGAFPRGLDGGATIYLPVPPMRGWIRHRTMPSVGLQRPGSARARRDWFKLRYEDDNGVGCQFLAINDQRSYGRWRITGGRWRVADDGGDRRSRCSGGGRSDSVAGSQKDSWPTATARKRSRRLPGQKAARFCLHLRGHGKAPGPPLAGAGLRRVSHPINAGVECQSRGLGRRRPIQNGEAAGGGQAHHCEADRPLRLRGNDDGRVFEHARGR